MKKNLLLVSLLFLAASAMAQNETIVVTTSKAAGETIRFLLKAAPADTADVWLDLNNNGVRDANEEPSASWGARVYYTLGAQTVTIHGKLTSFYCNTTGITSIDVSNNPNLLELNCGGNQITSVDVTNNPLLTYLAVYTDTLITTLDVSKNTALTELSCQQLKLTELDLSNNTALLKIYCYANNFSGSKMTSLMNSLPTTTGELYIFNGKNSPADKNVALPADVTIATGKGWAVYDFNGLIANRIVYTGATGINNITNSDLNILSKKGYLEFNVAQPGELVSIYNIAGKQVFQGQLNGTSVNVPLEKGIYLVRVNSKVCKAVVE